MAVLAVVLTSTTAPANPEAWRAAGWKTDFDKTTVLLTEILPGGPQRDGIPPIDTPKFKPAGEIDTVTDREPVIVFPLDANARAYPLQVLTWHEIVNDEIAGIPVAVTYCPLCNAALVFDRRVAGRVLDFGTSGLLRNSDLVMWDRQTESWWQQFTGEAIVGDYAGTRLKLLPSRVAAFGDFKKKWPDAKVLVPPSPGMRPYGRNPYVGYDSRAGPYEFFRGDLPQGMLAMERLVVARTDKGPVAVAMTLLAERARIEHRGVVFTWRAGQTSALDQPAITDSRDVGNVEVADMDNNPLVHDVTFAFVLYAFEPKATVLTAKGEVMLGTGKPAPR